MIGKEKNFTQKQFLDIMDIRSLEMLVFFRYLIVDNIYLILIIIIRLLYVKIPFKFKHSYIQCSGYRPVKKAAMFNGDRSGA